MLRTELQLAEGELKDRCWSPPPGLQSWLQLTHEMEHKTYMKKKISAEKQLQQAREAVSGVRCGNRGMSTLVVAVREVEKEEVESCGSVRFYSREIHR
jgi:stromal interaction molecule 1